MSAIYIVLTLVLVLAIPLRADAECAWVLWSDVTGPLGYTTPIFPVSASERKQVCEQERAKQVANYTRLRSKNTDVTVDEISGRSRVGVHKKTKDGSIFTTIYRFVCLPDTVDPSGVKEK